MMAVVNNRLLPLAINDCLSASIIFQKCRLSAIGYRLFSIRYGIYKNSDIFNLHYKII